MPSFERPKVLVVDDDPTHIQLYSLLLEGGGCDAIPLLVDIDGPGVFPDEEIALVLLDYRLNSVKTAEVIARELRGRFPTAPLIVLSDVTALPASMGPIADGFIRKGNPQVFLATIQKVMEKHLDGLVS
jgi:CheY-like chemotaxis protein